MDYLLYIPLDAAANGVFTAGAPREYANDDVRGGCLSYSASNTTGELFILTDFTFDSVSLNPATDYLAFWLYISEPTAVGTLVVEYASYQVHAGEEMSQYTLKLSEAVANGQLHAGWNPIVIPLDLEGFDIPYVVNATTGTKMAQVMRIRLMNGQNGNGKPLTYKIDDLAFVRGDALAIYAE